MDNKILIENLIQGNEATFSYIMDEYYITLCAYAFGLTKDKFKAEDIVQNVFLKIWKKRKNLSTKYPFKNYLYKSVYNEFIDQHRKNKLVLPLEKKHVKHLNAYVEDKDYDEMSRLVTTVKREIENLPPKCKAIFTMAKLEGLTYNEIAKYQNVSVRTVENQIHKAFSIIRNKIEYKIDTILFLLFKFNKKLNWQANSTYFSRKKALIK